MTPVSAAGQVRELLARAVSRESVRPEDARAGASYERVTIGGDAYFVKRLSPASDWIMRVTGDHVHRPYLVWQAGIMDRAPACIDHTVVAMGLDGEGDHAVLTMVMRDVGGCLVPPGNTVVPPGQHASFVAHMAALSAAFWGWDEDIGLTTMTERLRFFDSVNVAREMQVASPPGPIAAADAGWRALPDRSATLAALAQAVQRDPGLLTTPLAQTPVTFLHGDWKMGNLGSHPDGRTILIDWAYPGSGPACWDLWWYLALNAARLPESKEATITRFADALERHGVDTSEWFERQLDLCTVAIMVTFGWEKALGEESELRWWESRVVDALTRQGIELPAPTA